MDLLPIFIIVIVFVGLCYFGFIYLFKNKKPKKIMKSNIDIEALIDALGGKNNILSSSHSPSKISIQLKDYHITDIEKIKALGASGIVEGKDSLSLIFGKMSEAIDNDIKQYLG